MTKLFSMKTLAFAGAAAFALTLAAAPKADAAIAETDVEVDYSEGLLRVHNFGEATRTADGFGIYFGNGKDAEKAKKKLVVTPDTATATLTTPSSITYDISNLLGKKVIVAVGNKADGSDAVTKELKESPKVKAKDIETKILNAEKISDTQKYQYKIGTYGEWRTYYYDATMQADPYLKDSISRAKALGTTLYIRVADIKMDEGREVQDSAWSKEVKIKIKAKAKAPKVAIKTAKLTKAFEWNIAKYEYRVLVNGETSPWVDGAKEGWKALIDKASTATADKDKDVDLDKGIVTQLKNVTGLVQEEAIANDVVFQVRTKADTKKDASQIEVVNLEKSIDSPTKTQIAVKLTNNTKKNATVSKAAITPQTVAGYTAQYSTDNTKWKALTKEITMDADKVATLYIRLVGDGKDKTKASVLPSAVTTLTIPADGSKEDAKISAKVLEAKDGKWVETEVADYTA